MILLPWIAFFLGVGWIIWQASKEKKKYLKQKAIEAERIKGQALSEAALRGLRGTAQEQQQGQPFDLGLGGRPQRGYSA